MGKFDMFYEQLKSKMAGPPPMSLRIAVMELKAELQVASQNAGQLRSEEEHKRLDYSRRCSSALMDCAAEKIRKEAVFEATVKRIGKLIRKPGFNLSGGSGNWMASLMKTGDTPQDKGRNEKLIAQMALCTGQISGGEFNRIREAWYKPLEDEYPAGYGRSIVNEQLHAAAELLDALEEMFRLGRQRLDVAEDAVKTILSGEADDATLSKAFHIVESDEIRLLEDAQTCLDDFEKFEENRKLPAEKKRRRELWPPVEKVRMAKLREEAEQETQMLYAAMKEKAAGEEPEKAPEEPPAGEEKAPSKKLSDGQKRVMQNQQVNKFLKPYGLTWHDNYMKNSKSDRIAYRNEKTGKTVILQVTGVETPDGYRVEISDADPGRYVNCDLAEQMRQMKIKVDLLETRVDHSQEYLALQAQMTALEGLKFDDEPGPEQVKDAVNRFHLFGQALEKYIKARGGKPEPDQKLDWYENAVADLQSFARDKLIGIEIVDDHIKTKNQLELSGKEFRNAISAAQQKNGDEKARTSGLDLPEDYLGTVKKWNETFAGMTKEREKETAKAMRAAIAQAKEKNLKEIPRIKPVVVDYLKTLAESDNSVYKADRELLKTLIGTDLYAKAIKGDVGPDELADTMAKNALACAVAQELMTLESQMTEKAALPIKSLIDGGQLLDVVKMVKNSQSFGEHYRCLDLSGDPKKGLDKILKADLQDVPPPPDVVAREIMQSYLKAEKAAKQNRPGQAYPPVEQKDAQPVLNNSQVLQPQVK